MVVIEDDDIKLQQASASLITNFEQAVRGLIRSPSVQQVVREKDLFNARVLIEPFQADPQLLDAHLKRFIPTLVAAYLQVVGRPRCTTAKKGFLPLSYAICNLLDLFCKVRGEKVIKGFLDNDPRNLEPILVELETLAEVHSGHDRATGQTAYSPWIERYILLLWLSHLMLVPFPLDSISPLESSHEISSRVNTQLPSEMPSITLRVLTICVPSLHSASKERSTAAQLLVTMCLRPDMQELGLLDSLVQWSTSAFNEPTVQLEIHYYLGVLSFLSGVLQTANSEEISKFLRVIYLSCRRILDQDSLSSIRSSAVARKLVIKVMRNIVSHCLQATYASTKLDTTTLVEDVIEFLLVALADPDTPVRLAASKALSIVILRLDVESAEEVLAAILELFTENVHWRGSERNLNNVDPLKWHGLTLTLSHLLYRKAIPASSLPEVLGVLLLSLSFEQRSPTGGAVGTNVRDAACFGIWALSRRYNTEELLAINTGSIQAATRWGALSVPQVFAIELVITACLDPAGNIRRGSSAALQEMIGRHPNTIAQGIPLVQVVDFHAVGLRHRAIYEVTVEASELDPLYWEALFDGLLSWRGCGALDPESRLSAAEAIGRLSRPKSASCVHRMSHNICKKLGGLKAREIEERQGFIAALAAVTKTASIDPIKFHDDSLCHLWDLLNSSLRLNQRDFTSAVLRPEFTAASLCNFIGALAAHTTCLPSKSWPEIPVHEITRVLNLCLQRPEKSVLSAVEKTVPLVLELLGAIDKPAASALISSWLTELENEASYGGYRCAGHAIALGATYHKVPILDVSQDGFEERIICILAARCTTVVAIDARTTALKALSILLREYCHDRTHGSAPPIPKLLPIIIGAIHTALTDYSVTERGDVGSLVRLEALHTTSKLWASPSLAALVGIQELQIYADVLRLSLEKLDKVRSMAASVIRESQTRITGVSLYTPTDDVSSYAYFMSALKLLTETDLPVIKTSICIGFVSSAGLGSESVAQNARAALMTFLDAIPADCASSTDQYTLLQFETCMIQLVKENVDNDMILLPVLELQSFMLDMQILKRLQYTSFNFRVLLSSIQKAHFKSSHVRKLQLALDIYRCLGSIPEVQVNTIAKIRSMLLHPFPKIRITAAESLWCLTYIEDLRRQDWSISPRDLRPLVDRLENRI